MPLKLSDLTSKTKTIEVDFDGDKLSVTYKTGFYTPAVEAMFAAQDSGALSKEAEVLADAILDWDLTDDAGNKIEPTVEVMQSLGISILNRLAESMVQESLPLAKTGEN